MRRRALAFAAMSLMANMSPLCAGENSEPRIVEILATADNRFVLSKQPKQILAVKAGEPLLLRITAQRGSEMAKDGAVHSLVIRSARDEGWDLRLKEGSQDIPIKAPSHPGSYLIECTVRCGSGHESMNLKIQVTP